LFGGNDWFRQQVDVPGEVDRKAMGIGHASILEYDFEDDENAYVLYYR
jgi:hypothetical protein